MGAWMKFSHIGLLVFVFCVMQALSGCIILDWIDPAEEGKFDNRAEYWDEVGDPKIRSGLVLRVNVTASGAPVVAEMLQEVGGNGEMMMPLIGQIKCVGLTLLEFQKEIAKAYGEYFIEPQATVGFAYNPDNPVGKSPWGEVLVMGAVGRSGPVNMPPTRELLVTRALMLAGGISPLGDKENVRVTQRAKDGKITRWRVNVVKIGEHGRTELDIPLKAGDVVWVPETWY